MKKLPLAVMIWLACNWSHAQTYPFAQLTGSPQMDTQGWNLIGAARLGDTGGDADDLFNELVLCEPNPFTRGACFYQKPIDISRCQKWVAEFDYRIYDGTGADGIAFCFLNRPPNAFTFGGNIGIPARPQGLMVILDTYLNCTRLFNERVPKLEIRYSDGQTTYGDNTESMLECPIPAQPTSDKMDILRQPTYNRMKITYDEGDIKVYINGDYVLSGRYVVNYPAYFGFTASTGGFNDRHSIRNFTLYTFRPIDSPPNAGPDRVVCSGDEVLLGAPVAPNEPYVYSWYPTTGLDNPTSAQPKVRFVNETDNEVTYTYFLTKDSVVSTNRCAYSDEVNITVLGKIARAGPDLNLCSGQTEFINALSRDGYAYAWSPTTGLTEPNDARTFIRLENHSDAPITYQYVLSVTPLASPGCTVRDTLLVTVQPEGAISAVPEDMQIKAVSTQVAQEHNVEVRFRISPASALRNSITLSRRTLLPQEGDWAVIASLSRNDSLYTDPDLATDSQGYEYRLEGADLCNEPVFSVPHHSILLQGTGDEPNETVHLNWNAYSGWPKGVKQYEIWRKINEEEMYSRYDTTGRNQLAWSRVNATDGYLHCYRIRATEDAGSSGVSWSNEVCLEFEHPLFIPNVVTPNGDHWNDTWVIRNLELYPEHTLTIVNRYGQTILQTQQYQQDWNGEELSTGLYYYYLTTARKQQHFRGWVQVLR